ncbi:MAG: ABC transporter permease [Lachnospiraceae bacterium]|nr:ABC transporter permease [Lachnospiraceae bacterium]
MIKRVIVDLVKYKSYIIFSAKSSLKAEVNNAYLDWLWWVLEPIGYSIIYILIFQNIFKTSAEHYPIFVFCGSVIWNFFSKSVSSSVQLIRNNENIIAKVYIPKYILLIVEMLVNTFKLAINILIVFGMMLLYGVSFSGKMFLAIPVIILLFLFTFGMGVICMHIGVYIEDLSYVMNIGLNMLMFLSGTFYSMDSFPAPYGELLTRFNPIAFIITSFREVVIYDTFFDYFVWAIWSIVSFVLCLFGMSIVYRNENNYVKVI